MAVQEKFIETLRVPKSHKCECCGNNNYFDTKARHNIANCIMANGGGIFALVNCNHCGYVMKVYPVRINGRNCRESYCNELFAKLKEEVKENEYVKLG